MHIFIDESGTFSPSAKNAHSVSAVGALVIPDAMMPGFEKLYGRLRRKLPTEKGEVKGRTLKEHDVAEVTDLLRRLNAIFEIVVTDTAFQTEAELVCHRDAQGEKLTANLNKIAQGVSC